MKFRIFPVIHAVFWLSAALFAAPGAAAAVQPLDRIVAVVNDDVILLSELAAMTRTTKQQLAEQNTRLPPESVLQRQILERLIINRLQLQLAARAGIRVDDETLNRAIRNIAEQNGLSLDEFRKVLERDGFNFARFRENIREEMIISRLRQQQVASRITVSEREVDNFLANREVQGDDTVEYRVAHILIALPEAASPEQIRKARDKAQKVLEELRGGADFGQMAVAVSDARQALEGGDLGWLKASELPTLFADIVPKMKPGELSGPHQSPSGFHIIKLVATRGQDKHVVTQTLVRHILVRPNELLSDEEARLRLEQLRERIEAGEDFATLARSHSDDGASAAEGGSLGWVSPGALVPEFEEFMNRLQPGELSQPFRTRFGWHLVQVLERRKHDSTEEFRRARAREIIRKRKMEEELELWLRRLRDEAYVEYRLDE